VVREAERQFLTTQRARVRLGNAELKEIRDKLKANEQALADGRAALDEALGTLQQVQRVLEAATALLRVVGRVITLAAPG
jgi:hypothetical protein